MSWNKMLIFFGDKKRFRKSMEDDNLYSLAEISLNEKYKICEGFVRWNSENPNDWAGPYLDKQNNPWVGFTISDSRYSPYRTSNNIPLMTIEEIHEENKRRAELSRYNYPRSFWKRFGKDIYSEYWHIVIHDTVCSRTELTPEELEEFYKFCTPAEKISAERAIAKYISSEGECDPFKAQSVENHIRLFAYGNDDTSWTINGSFSDDDSYDSFQEKIFRFLRFPSWMNIKHSDSGWYFSN